MTKGDKPIAIERFENISLSGWENTKVSGDGTYKSVKLDVSNVKKESKTKTKEQRTNEDYQHKSVNISYRQMDNLIAALTRLREKMQ